MTEIDLSSYKGYFGYCRNNTINKLAGVTLELIGAAKELSKQLSGEEVSVFLISGNNDVNNHVKEISEAGANKIYLIQDESLEQYSTELYSNVISDAIIIRKTLL